MKWTYYFARKFSASRFEIVMRVYFSEFYQKEFDAGLQNILVKPTGDNHAVYYIQKEWDEFANKVYQKVCADLKSFKRYVKLIKKTQVRSLGTAKPIVQQPLTKLSWEKLGKFWRKWDKSHLDHFIKPIWIPFIIEPLLAKDAQDICHKHNLPVDLVFNPDQANAITREQISLTKIAI